MYSAEFRPGAARQLGKLTPEIQRRVARVIDRLVKDPRPRGARKLEGVEGLYRLRFGDYRILYQVLDQTQTLLVVAVGDRKDIYRPS